MSLPSTCMFLYTVFICVLYAEEAGKWKESLQKVLTNQNETSKTHWTLNYKQSQNCFFNKSGWTTPVTPHSNALKVNPEVTTAAVRSRLNQIMTLCPAASTSRLAAVYGPPCEQGTCKGCCAALQTLQHATVLSVGCVDLQRERTETMGCGRCVCVAPAKTLHSVFKSATDCIQRRVLMTSPTSLRIPAPRA